MTITKSVTFIAKEGCEAKMKELFTAMVEPSKAEHQGFIFMRYFNMKITREDLWL